MSDVEHPSTDEDPESSGVVGVSVFGRPVRRLDRPLSQWSSVAGWVAATILFVVMSSVWYSLGGLPGDAAESAVPAVAIAHGDFNCAYASRIRSSVPPLYPLVAAGVMAATGIGRSGLPPAWVPTSGCRATPSGADVHHGAVRPVLLIGFLGWPVLLAGFVWLLRVAGRGKNGWEVLGACLLACLPQVAAPLVQFFHPEDLLAMGLILGALASATRSRWMATGVLIGLACCAKQYALLAGVPLLVVAPDCRRAQFAIGAAGAVVLVVVPLGLVVGRGMFVALIGANATPTGTNTPVGMLHLRGAALVVVSRVLPLALAALLAFWARWRLKQALCRPAALVALVAGSLALRLVFEVSLYDYYFMALCVALVALDMVSGKLRTETIAWIVVAAAFFPPVYERLVAIETALSLLVQSAIVVSGFVIAVLPLVDASGSGRPDPSSPVIPSPPPSENATCLGNCLVSRQLRPFPDTGGGAVRPLRRRRSGGVTREGVRRPGGVM